MRHQPKTPLENRNEHHRRRIARVLAVIYLVSQFTPYAQVLAGPQHFSRPGPGVSRLPLNVTAFNAPGFGEVADAVNVANGNVYVSTDQLSRNNVMGGGQDGRGTIGNGQWSLSPTMRLYGYAQQANALTTDASGQTPAISSSYWTAYGAKPSTTAYRLGSADGGTGCDGKTSGLHIPQGITAGRYKVAFDGRSIGSSLSVQYGASNSVLTPATLTTNWQRFTQEYTYASDVYALFSIAESTTANPSWDLANIDVRKWDTATGMWGLNLVPTQDLRNTSYWSGYCVYPSSVTQIDSNQMFTADMGGPTLPGTSGFARDENLGPGKYVVSLEARTTSGTLLIDYGLSDNKSVPATINTQWQSLSSTFDLTTTSTRMFEVLERTLQNPTWEVRNIVVKPIATEPNIYTMAIGDGTTVNFKRQYPPNTAWYDDKPNWINRYRTSTAPGVIVYGLEPQAGSQYSAEWLVRIDRGASGVIIHHFDRSGNRSSFLKDGEYADYAMNLSQQFRAAQAGDPSGETTAFKTEYTYISTTSGRLRQIKDEYGRATEYVWRTGNQADGTDGTVAYVNQMVDTPLTGTALSSPIADNAATARRSEFTYQGIDVNGRQLLTGVTYKSRDGKGGWLLRSSSFEYTSGENGVLLFRIKRTQAGPANGTALITTEYSYDKTNTNVALRDRVIKVTETGKTDLTYAYAPSTVWPGGRVVTMAQGDKKTVYNFDRSGQLRKKVVDDKNPNTGSITALEWRYEYYYTGNLALLVEPTGKSMHFVYDKRGNMVRRAVYATNPLDPSYIAPIDVGLSADSNLYVFNRGSTPSFTAQMVNDTSNMGMTWTLKKGSGPTPVTIRSFSPAVTFDANEAKSTAQATLLSTDTAVTGTDYWLEVKSNKDPSKIARINIVIDRKYQGIDAYYPQVIRLSPYCMSMEGSQVCGTDAERFRDPAARAAMLQNVWSGDWISLDGKATPTAGFSGQVGTGVTWTPAPNATYPDIAQIVSNRMRVYYDAARAGQTVRIRLLVSAADDLSVAEYRYIDIKFFGLQFPTTGDPTLVRWPTTAMNDGTVYQLAARAVNEPWPVSFERGNNPIKLTWTYSPKGSDVRTIGYHDAGGYGDDALLPGVWTVPWNGTTGGYLTTGGCLRAPEMGRWGVWPFFGQENTRDINVSVSLESNPAVSINRNMQFQLEEAQINQSCQGSVRPEVQQALYINDNGLLTDSPTPPDTQTNAPNAYPVTGQRVGFQTNTLVTIANNITASQSSPTGVMNARKDPTANPIRNGRKQQVGTRVINVNAIKDLYNTPDDVNGVSSTGADALAAPLEPEPVTTLKAGYKTLEIMAYDKDNRMVSSFRPAPDIINAGGLSHTYQSSEQLMTYTDTSFTAANGQIFTHVNKVVQSSKLGGTAATSTTIESGFALPIGGTEQRNTTSVIDTTTGLLTSSTLNWDTKNRVSTYTYWDGSSVVLPNAYGATGSRSAKQYKDLVRQVVTSSNEAGVVAGSIATRTQRSTYDELGNVIKDELDGVANNLTLGAAVNNLYPVTGATTATRTTNRAYNAFGQMIWEKVDLGGVVSSERGMTYHPSGELKLEWSGTPDNLTTYTYDLNAFMVRQTAGVGSSASWSDTASVGTVHKQYDFTYDTFGRTLTMRETNATETTNTEFKYDTLDRVVLKRLPDASKTETEYDSTGGEKWVKSVGVGGIVKLSRAISHDVYGRTTREVSTPGSTTFGPAVILEYVYDKSDRVLTVTTSDAGTGTASISDLPDDRVSVTQYDDEGRVKFVQGPALRGATEYKDARKAAAETKYDKLGRAIKSVTRLYGASIPIDLLYAAETNVQYDGFGNAVKVANANGAVLETGFDAAGKPFVTQQQIWYGTEPAVVLGTATATDRAKNWTAYDALGRAVISVDPLGARTQLKYDLLGNKIAEINANDRLEKGYTFTKDGLLEGVWTTKIGSNATAAQFGPLLATPAAPDTAKFTLIQTMNYGNRAYPSSVRKATQDNAPTSSTAGGVLTSFTYDYAGRALVTTLPADQNNLTASVTQVYDEAGNVTSVTDPDGFKTVTTYNHLNKPITQTQNARTSNQTDIDAGLGAGLTSSFEYDGYGNLIKKTERGLVTEYRYNSAGKVVAERRPYKAGATVTPQWKRTAYRLDGAVIARTNYAFTGANFSFTPGAPILADQQLANVSTGNLQAYGLDKLGQTIEEVSYGQLILPTGNIDTVYTNAGGSRKEKRVLFTYDARGLRVARELVEGDYAIYAAQRDSLGRYLLKNGTWGVNPGAIDIDTWYATYSKYNARGELNRQWNKNKAVTEFNIFTYDYGVTGKQKTATRDIRISMTPFMNDANLGGVGSQVMLAASVGTTTTDYNERDLPSRVTISDKGVSNIKDLDATAKTKITDYTYYADGMKSLVTVDPGTGQATQSYKYDARGREIESIDSNGSVDLRDLEPNAIRKNITGPVKTATTYGVANVSKLVTDNVAKKYYQQDTVMTIGGQAREMKEWEWNPAKPAPEVYTEPVFGTGTPTRTTTIKYNTDGSANEQRMNSIPIKYFGTEKIDATSTTTQVTTSSYDALYGLPTVQSTRVDSNTTGTSYQVLSWSCSDQVATFTNSGAGDATKSYPSCAGSKSITIPQGSEVLDSNQQSYNPKKYLGSAQVNDYAYRTPNLGWGPYNDNYFRNQTMTTTYDAFGNVITKQQATTATPPPPVYDAPTPSASSGNIGSGALISFKEHASNIIVKGEEPNFDNVTMNYVLDSRGNRIKVLGGRYDNYAKRYSADDEATWFTRWEGAIGEPYAAHNDFVNDPFGETALTSTGGLRQPTVSSALKYEIVRDVSSRYDTDGDVQVIRKHKGKLGNWATVKTEEDYNNLTRNDRMKDQTFSMADGLLDSTEWVGVVPFSVPSIDGGVVVLEAPQTAFSVQFGFDPLAVTAPDSSVPGTAVGDAGQVSTPDAPANPQTGGTEPTLKPQAKATTVSTPAFGVTITELPSEPAAKPTTPTGKPAANTPPASSNPSASQAQTPAFTSEVALEAPSSVLPPSITSTLDASSVLSPDTTSSGLPNLGADPSAITSPGSSAPPAVGATPKDGPEGIQSPSSATGGVLPPVTSLPDAGSVVSPGSSGTVKALGEVTVYVGVSLDDVLKYVYADLSTYDDKTREKLKGVLEDRSTSVIDKLFKVIEAISESQKLGLTSNDKRYVKEMLDLAREKPFPNDAKLGLLLDLTVYLMSSRGYNTVERSRDLKRWGEMARNARVGITSDSGDFVGSSNRLLKELYSAVKPGLPLLNNGRYDRWVEDVHTRVDSRPGSQKVWEAAESFAKRLALTVVLGIFTEGLISGARWATGKVGQIPARGVPAAQVKSVVPNEAIVLGSDAETLAVANAWKAEAGYQDVIAHGTMDSTGKFVFIVNGKALTAEELARMIRSDPNFKGGAVRLLSCNSGCGETPGAEALAKALGVPVKAPVGKPGAYEGSPYVYEPGPPGYPKIPQNPQRWVVCEPGKGCK